MDTNEKKPIFIHSFHYDTGTQMISITASQQGERPETMVLQLGNLPETDRRGFLGAINSVLPQSLRELAVWKTQTFDEPRDLADDLAEGL